MIQCNKYDKHEESKYTKMIYNIIFILFTISMFLGIMYIAGNIFKKLPKKYKNFL